MVNTAQTTASENDFTPAAAAGDQNQQTISAAAGSAGSGGAKPRRSAKGSNIRPLYGERAVKQYPIQERELDDLFRIGVIATGSLAGASWMFSVSLDVFLNLSLATGLAATTTLIWHTVAWVCGILCLILILAGVVFIYVGNNRIKEIKKETTFSDQQ
jgi:hypothetical protein